MADDDVEIIRPPSLLKDRVHAGGPNAMDAVLIERAEQAITDMADNYLDWVGEDLEKIREAFDRLLTGSGDRAGDIQKIFSVAHDIKGQGSSFGYELITTVGSQLCRVLERFDGSVDPEVENEAIRIHIDAMKLIIANRMQGDGGAEGEAILQGIHRIAAKLIPNP